MGLPIWKDPALTDPHHSLTVNRIHPDLNTHTDSDKRFAQFVEHYRVAVNHVSCNLHLGLASESEFQQGVRDLYLDTYRHEMDALYQFPYNQELWNPYVYLYHPKNLPDFDHAEHSYLQDAFHRMAHEAVCSLQESAIFFC